MSMSDPTEDIVLLTLLDEWGLPDEAAGHVRGTFAYQTRLLATRTADLGADILDSVPVVRRRGPLGRERTAIERARKQ